MAAGANATLYTGANNLKSKINPQVIADFIDVKLVDAIRFSPLARMDYTLVGRPGDEILLPSYAYIGDATAVNEGADIPIAKLTQSTTKVTVAKVGRAVEYSDEALIMGYNGDIAEEAAKQILVSINSKIEADLISAMNTTATLSYDYVAADDPADNVADALTLFGEDIDGEKVIVIPPSFYASLRKSSAWIPNTEIGADVMIRGTVGMIHGCQVITANRLTSLKAAFIVKPGALAIYMKRDTLVETDRDKLAQTNFIIGSKIVAPYVYDKTKLIKIDLDPS